MDLRASRIHYWVLPHAVRERKSCLNFLPSPVAEGVEKLLQFPWHLKGGSCQFRTKAEEEESGIGFPKQGRVHAVFKHILILESDGEKYRFFSSKACERLANSALTPLSLTFFRSLSKRWVWGGGGRRFGANKILLRFKNSLSSSPQLFFGGGRGRGSLKYSCSCTVEESGIFE